MKRTVPLSTLPPEHHFRLPYADLCGIVVAHSPGGSTVRFPAPGRSGAPIVISGGTDVIPLEAPAAPAIPSKLGALL